MKKYYICRGARDKSECDIIDFCVHAKPHTERSLCRKRKQQQYHYKSDCDCMRMYKKDLPFDLLLEAILEKEKS